jgi:hypothetical protein
MKFKKIIFLLVITILHFHISRGQCNTTLLSKRSYSKFSSVKEKIVAIRLTARLNYQDLIAVESEAQEATLFIKTQLNNGEKPDISNQIEKVKARKKGMEKLNQISETIRFDILTYCFYNFMIDTYQRLQQIIDNNDVTTAQKKMVEFSKELRYKEESKIIEIDKENDYIERTYPLNRN